MKKNKNKTEELMRVDAEDLYETAYGMEAGSEEQAKTIETANSIVDRLNESVKLKGERTDRWIKLGVTVAMFLGSLGLSVWANKDSKKFEGAFTHTTEAGRSSQRNLLSFFDRQKF